MTNPWQSPGGDVPPPPPQFGGYAAPPPPQLQQPVWAPPPKPGLIPLRPLTLGTMLGASFQVMRRNPRPTFGLSLLFSSAVSVVTLAVIGGFAFFAFGRIQAASDSDEGSIIAGSILGGGLTLLIPLAGGIVLTALLQGLISLEVARATLGEKLNTRGLLRIARGRIGALVGWSFAIIGSVAVLFAVVTLAVTLLIAFGDTVGAVIGVLLAIGFVLLFTVVSVWIGTKVSLVPSVLLLERATLRGAIVRSWTLTNRSFWKTLGIQLLVSVIISAASQVITFPISLVSSLVTGIVVPTSDPTGAFVSIGITYLVLIFISLVIGAVGTVMQSATATLIYLDLRMRREGLDLELMRFVEARQAGDTTVIDPYLTVPGNAPPPPPTAPWA